MPGAIATDTGGRRNGKPVAEPNVVHRDQSLAYSKVVDAMTHLHEDGFAKVGICAERAET